MSPRLEVRAVAKRWDGETGLPPVSFEVRAGSLAVVRGRSGSGKSTLLAVIAGLCAADEGDVRLDGQPAPRRPTWADVALVPQVLALAPELTVRENVVDGTDPIAAARADALLGALDLGHVAARPPDTCSMGEQQRAALARALVGGSRVVLADEPTSHQDAARRDAVVAALRAAADEGAAVVVVSHDAELWRAADVVITLGAEL